MPQPKGPRRRARAKPRSTAPPPDFITRLIADVEADWSAHGRDWVAHIREEKPTDYLRLVVALSARAAETRAPDAAGELDVRTDEEIDALIRAVAERLGWRIAEAGDGKAADREGPPP